MSVEIKLSARALPEQRWKVKSNPVTRKYGVTMRSILSALDCKGWPGEVGTVVKRTWSGVTDGEPWTNSGLWLELSRGRSYPVECLDLADFVKVSNA